mmetsp:Transcript_5530/g.13246  ORF Transcript_5530/g.13246 Transcript_5530/m.13246 type:complete len:249 (+) Transcript_5530:1491-2237(+)
MTATMTASKKASLTVERVNGMPSRMILLISLSGSASDTTLSAPWAIVLGFQSAHGPQQTVVSISISSTYILALPGSAASAASLGPMSSSWKFFHTLGTSDWTPEMVLLACEPIREPALRIQGRMPDIPEASDAGFCNPDIISDTGPDTLELPFPPPPISDLLVSTAAPAAPFWCAALYLPVIAEANSLRSSCSMARRIISGRPMPPPKARRAPRRRRPPPPAPGRPRASTTRGRAKESRAAASSAAAL